jgi:hypothetical protein
MLEAACADLSKFDFNSGTDENARRPLRRCPTGLSTRHFVLAWLRPAIHEPLGKKPLRLLADARLKAGHERGGDRT